MFTTSPSNEWLRAEFTIPGTGCVHGQSESGSRRTFLQPRDTGAGFWACTEMRKGPEGYAWDVDGIRKAGSPIWSLIVSVLVFIPTSEIFFFKSSLTNMLYLFLFLIYFWLWLGLHCCAWAFSSCGERGLLFVVVCGLPITVASLVAEHGL